MKSIPASEMIGMRFERLVILAIDGRDSGRGVKFQCRCDCGTIKSISKKCLVSGNTKSCGCFASDRMKALATHKETIGYIKTSTYATWQNIKSRCNNPNSPQWHLYGGKGVKMHPEWEQSFEKFLADVGRKPAPGYSIERNDSNGNYEPGNVRWATAKEQSRNTSQVRMIEYDGKTQCLSAWAEELGLDQQMIRSRLDKLKWTVEKAFTTPNKLPRTKAATNGGNPLCPHCQSRSRKGGKKYGKQKFICVNWHSFSVDARDPKDYL